MTKEDIQSGGNEQVNQGHHDYIELWFQETYQFTTFLHSSTILDIISIKAVGFSYSGIYQSISFKLEYEFICNLVMHMAPLEVFLYLKEILFFKQSRIG
jgi:hypothetical protein